jgi:hypothetical protein
MYLSGMRLVRGNAKTRRRLGGEVLELLILLQRLQRCIGAHMQIILKQSVSRSGREASSTVSNGWQRTSKLYLPCVNGGNEAISRSVTTAANGRTFRPAALTSSGLPDSTRSNWVRAPSLSPMHASRRPYSKSRMAHKLRYMDVGRGRGCSYGRDTRCNGRVRYSARLQTLPGMQY